MASESRRHGFTLIEVLAALLIVSLVFGLLLEAVTRNLASLTRARAEARSAQLAENRLRDLRADLETGEKVEDGVKEGVFDEPDNDLHWRITILPQQLLLPADYPGELSPSPLYQLPAGAHGAPPPPQPPPGAPPQPGQDPNEPPLRLVEVRVFTQDVDPNTVEPFVVLLTTPSSQAQQPPQQPGQTQPGTPGTPGTQPAPNGTGGMGSTGRLQ